MSPAKIEDLRQRMRNHTITNVLALVRLTAIELEELLITAEALNASEMFSFWEIWNCEKPFCFCASKEDAFFVEVQLEGRIPDYDFFVVPPGQSPQDIGYRKTSGGWVKE